MTFREVNLEVGRPEHQNSNKEFQDNTWRDTLKQEKADKVHKLLQTSRKENNEQLRIQLINKLPSI